MDNSTFNSVTRNYSYELLRGRAVLQERGPSLSCISALTRFARKSTGMHLYRMPVHIGRCTGILKLHAWLKINLFIFTFSIPVRNRKIKINKFIFKELLAVRHYVPRTASSSLRSTQYVVLRPKGRSTTS